jgi:hypothetical protein
MQPVSAKCGHVKRRLKQGQPLTGAVLEFALSVLPENDDSAFGIFLKGIAPKLQSATQLTDYEAHIFVDVVLLHERLSPPDA